MKKLKELSIHIILLLIVSMTSMAVVTSYYSLEEIKQARRSLRRRSKELLIWSVEE
jgi:hypothetical protein